MTDRRAMSLIEVLAATVLLAVLAATCVPLLQRAGSIVSESRQQSAITVHQLSEVVDAILADPTIVGHDELPDTTQFQLPWPPPPEVPPEEESPPPEAPEDSEHTNNQTPDEIPNAPPITVTRLQASDEDVNHQWLVFTCDGVTVCRWLAIEENQESTNND